MKAGLVEAKSSQGRRVLSNKQRSNYDACKEFAKLVINEPLVYDNYGKMSTKKQMLEKDLNEERIEVLLHRKSK